MTSFWSQYFPPEPEWSIDDVPDQSGKVVLITGGNTGLGTSAVHPTLCLAPYRVYVQAMLTPR